METHPEGRVNLREFYQVRSPARWGGVPEWFSHSALARIELCPRKYQLEKSEFPVVGRFPSRPNGAAIEGSIAHECLELLFKEFAMAGLPELGSEAARDCIRQIDLTTAVTERLRSFQEILARHPRGQGTRLRSSAQQIANCVIQLFRQQYAQIDRVVSKPAAPYNGSMVNHSKNPENLTTILNTYGSLSELRLSHPVLPFDGIIDLVYNGTGGTVIVDFKTGIEKQEHLDQAYRYALLWWRVSSELPSSIEVRYMANHRESPAAETTLIQVENSLKDQIQRAAVSLSDTPGKANQGTHCRYCDVRQFCDDYWSRRADTMDEQGQFLDLEVSVIGQPAATGFAAKTRAGELVDVVFEPNVGKLLFPEIENRQSYRVIGVRFDQQKKSLLVLPSSEAWSMGSES